MPWRSQLSGHDSRCEIMYLSIIMEESSRAVGLAKPLPAMSGAEPWTASKIEASCERDEVQPERVDEMGAYPSDVSGWR